MQKWQQWESASEADWGLAVEREAVVRIRKGPLPLPAVGQYRVLKQRGFRIPANLCHTTTRHPRGLTRRLYRSPQQRPQKWRLYRKRRNPSDKPQPPDQKENEGAPHASPRLRRSQHVNLSLLELVLGTGLDPRPQQHLLPQK